MKNIKNMKKREKRNRIVAGVVVVAIAITFVSSLISILVSMI